MTEFEKIKKILSYYGEESQKRQCIEEMAELTQAINKEWRFKKGLIQGNAAELENNIIEEAADVIICLKQLIVFYKRKRDFLCIIQSKLDRTLERIEEIKGAKKMNLEEAMTILSQVISVPTNEMVNLSTPHISQA